MSGLDLKGTPLASRATQERTKRALDVLADVQAEVAQLGLPEYPKPTSAPEPLADIDVGSLTNRELESQLARYVAYAMYILPKLAEAEAAYKISAANLKAVSASLKLSLFKDGTPKSEIDARVQASTEYAEQELEQLKLYCVKEILEAHYKAYSKQYGVLSRAVELRKLEYEQEMRHSAIASYKPRPSTGGIPAGLRRK